MEKCCYKNCEKKATTNGFIFARNPEGGSDIPINVQACDVHKNVAGFFESTQSSQ